MTRPQKTIIGVAFAAAVGTGIVGTRLYKGPAALTLRSQVQSLQQQQSAVKEQIRQLTRERDAAKRQVNSLADAMESMKSNSMELPKLRGEVTRLRGDAEELAKLKAASRTNDAREFRAWVDRARQLEAHSAANPDLQIPEFRLLTEQDWLRVARDIGKPGNRPDPDLRLAMSYLRHDAEAAFADLALKAVKEYAKANNGQFPTDVSQLKPYFKEPVGDDILQRYMIVPKQESAFKGKNWDLGGKWVISEKAVVDKQYDWPVGIGMKTSAFKPPQAASQ